MLTVLPSSTDFYSAAPRLYPGVELLPPHEPAAWLLPLPRKLEVLKATPQRPRSVRSVLTSAGDETERELAKTGVNVPDHGEGYAISPVHDELVLASRSKAGLLHGNATLAQLDLWQARSDGDACAVRVADFPATAIRFLGGWALWRADGLREAIDIACAFKANRVLYNAWGWILADRLWDEDAWLVQYARDRGVELVFELRRMSFGRELRIAEPENRRMVIDAYVRAAGAGFRSFGLLFDDVPWETADDECALAEDILGALAARVTGPELFVCPQFYWYPGQMDSKWRGRAGPEETTRQLVYLETYGRRLPQGVHVYVANYWGDHPEPYEGALRAELTDLVGRKPIFFDNQLINDYRHGALYPFALHSRPATFGEHYAGYYLNCGRPLSAYAASAATALAYAWNPASYRPEQAIGAAIRWLHAPSEERSRCVVNGLNHLRALANEWAGGVHTAVSHYATIWRQVHDGKASQHAVSRWRDGVRAVREDWLAALREPAGGARPMAIEGLLALVRDSHRLERDLELFAAFVELRWGDRQGNAAIEDIDGFEALAKKVAKDALSAVGALLPPAPGLDPLLEDPGSLDPSSAQAWSWVEYFHANTRRTLAELETEMLEELRKRR